MSVETEQLAYLAGIVDGEGSVSAHGRSPTNPQHQAIKLCVSMTDVAPLLEFHQLFGGKLYREKRITKTGKPIFTWNIYSRKAAEVLETLLPYLRVKKLQSQDAIALAKLHLNKGNQWKARKVSSELRFQREVLYQRIRYRSKHGYSDEGSGMLLPVAVAKQEEQRWLTF